MKFTDQIAHYIFENQLDLEQLTIVLPSERAKKYIAASLFERNGKSLLAPEMITIDRWIHELSSKTIIDKTRALIQLYFAQINDQNPQSQHSFDEFMTWGTILLSDFDDIDRYLLESKQVFKNLADIKELEAWNFGDKEPSKNQKKFMEFWDLLPDYYQALNKRLSDTKTCYPGSAYREVAQNIDLVFQKNKNQHFLFAGFNALSKAEISIMKQLQTMGRGHILINADRFYLDNPTHEAGQFLRQLKTELNTTKLDFVENNLLTASKKIEVIECAQTTGQVKVAATKLLRMSHEEINETLILLADENLIVPLLRNLPRNISKANITLGMPLKSSALRNWVEMFFTIQEGKSRFKTEALYYADLQRLLNHPFIIGCSSESELNLAQQLEQSIVRFNRIFLKRESLELGETVNQIIALATTNWNANWLQAIETIRTLSRLLFSKLQDDHQFEKALLEGFDKALVDFENIISEGIPEMNLRSFKSLFNQHWSSKSIAYHGNPIGGLQIMGLLETRLLDFKRIICLGLNEGSMPPTNPIQTMIPMDLRRYLQLPTPREKQGLFAHHFYRLLHACEELVVTYTSASENIGSNEQSRYLLQLELELCRKNPNISFVRKFYTIPMEKESSMIKSIQKVPEIIARMDQMFAKSMSASLVKTFYTCPLDFYYKNVLEFGEQDAVEEEIEASSFGTFIHETLEDLFEPFARRDKNRALKKEQIVNVTSRDIDVMLKGYELILREKFAKHFDNDPEAFASGKNLLSFQMASVLLKRFLQSQKTFVESQNQLFIESLEEKLTWNLEVDVFGEKKTVQLVGFIDRIDSVNGKTRIIDYKSGTVKEEDVTISYKEGDSMVEKINKSKHGFQLLMYSYLYKMNYGVLPDEVGIYSFVKNKAGLFSFTIKNQEMSHFVDEFPKIVGLILEDIYNPEIGFEHNSALYFSYCKYCD